MKFNDIILVYASATTEHIDQLKVVEQHQDLWAFEEYMRKSAESKQAIILVVSRAKQTTV